MMRTLFILGSMTFAGSCLGAEMPQSITELGCTNCHRLDAKVVGPSWTEIANRYREKRDDPATVEQLVKNVSNGSSTNNWGNLPMTASDPTGRKRVQIVETVKYILSLPEPAAHKPTAGQPASGQPVASQSASSQPAATGADSAKNNK